MTRKLWIPFILLVLLSVSALAVQLPPGLLESLGGLGGEEVPLNVKEERLVVYDGYVGGYADYAVIVENPNDRPATASGEVQLVDGSGAVIATGTIYGTFPGSIPAGGLGYAIANIHSLSAEDVQKELTATVTLTGTAYEDAQPPVSLPVTVEMAQEEQEAVLTDGMAYKVRILNTVENNSGADAFDIKVVNVLRDKDGKLLSIRNAYASDMGVPAGGRLLVRNDHDLGAISFLTGQGQAVEKVEAFAFLEKE